MCLVPGGNRGVGDQGRCVGRHPSAQQAGTDTGRATGPRSEVEHVTDRAPGGERTVDEQDPDADAHRRARLEHAQHVQEALRASEVVNQGEQGDADRARGAQLRPPRQHRPPRQGGAGGEDRRSARQPAGEQIAGDVGLRPGRWVDDRVAVIRPAGMVVPSCAPVIVAGARPRAGLAARAHVLRTVAGDTAVAHRRAPAKDSAAPANRPPAATPTRFHIAGRSRVVTTGSGGSP
jgi:hypothetical protein